MAYLFIVLVSLFINKLKTLQIIVIMLGIIIVIIIIIIIYREKITQWEKAFRMAIQIT